MTAFFFSNKLAFTANLEMFRSVTAVSRFCQPLGGAQQWVGAKRRLASWTGTEREHPQSSSKGERAHPADPLILSPSPSLCTFGTNTQHTTCVPRISVFRSTSQSHQSGRPAIRHRKWLLGGGGVNFKKRRALYRWLMRMYSVVFVSLNSAPGIFFFFLSFYIFI